MDMEQYLFEDDSEIGAIIFITRDDPMLPTLPSPEIPEEILEEDTVPVRIVTPLHSPHPFLSDDLLQGDKSQLSNYQTSVDSENTNSELLDCIYPLPWTLNRDELPSRNRKRRSGPSACDIPVKRNKRNTGPSILNSGGKTARRNPNSISMQDAESPVAKPLGQSILIVRPLFLPGGQGQDAVQPPSLLSIVAYPSPALVGKLTELHKARMCPSDCEMLEG